MILSLCESRTPIGGSLLPGELVRRRRNIPWYSPRPHFSSFWTRQHIYAYMEVSAELEEVAVARIVCRAILAGRYHSGVQIVGAGGTSTRTVPQ